MTIIKRYKSIKKYKISIEYLAGKPDYKYEVYVQDAMLGHSGTVSSWKTLKQAQHAVKELRRKILKQFEKGRRKR